MAETLGVIMVLAIIYERVSAMMMIMMVDDDMPCILLLMIVIDYT